MFLLIPVLINHNTSARHNTNFSYESISLIERSVFVHYNHTSRAMQKYWRNAFLLQSVLQPRVLRSFRVGKSFNTPMHRFVLKDNEILGERRNKTKWREILTSFISYVINDGLTNLSITALKNDWNY